MSTNAVGYGPCPRCGKNVAQGAAGHTLRERSPTGNTVCGACAYKGPTSEWPREAYAFAVVLDYKPRAATDIIFDPPKFPETRSQADDHLDEDARLLLSELDGHHATDMRTVRDWLTKVRDAERERCARIADNEWRYKQIAKRIRSGVTT
ncbi:MAG TPA: hypothetical protein VGO53_16285 [Steroidobacteraceae bacterium]|jgi:hypothetical protein|nr:hypothetical protein [Steroidobacteraceae bacterium]